MEIRLKLILGLKECKKLPFKVTECKWMNLQNLNVSNEKSKYLDW